MSDTPDVLLGESLAEYTRRHLTICCSAWSASRNTSGYMDIAQTELAAATEKRVRGAIDQFEREAAALRKHLAAFDRQLLIQTEAAKCLGRECSQILAALRLADAAERQVPVAWMYDAADDMLNDVTQSQRIVATWPDKSKIVPLYTKLSGAADEKAG